MSDFHNAREFAQFIKALGFRAFVAGTPQGSGARGYGCITDADGSRVLSFQLSDGGTLGGNYRGDRQSGSGWRMERDLYSLKSAADVKAALYAMAPGWTGFNRSAPRCHACGQSTGAETRAGTYTTLAQYLAAYQQSSKFEEV